MNKDYVIINGELYHADELYHYGVPGMKWGRRQSTGVENAYSRKIAKKAKRLNEAELHSERKTKENLGPKGLLKYMFIGGIPMAVAESARANRRDRREKQLNKAIDKAKAEGYDVEVKRLKNIRDGNAVVDAVLKDKSGNTYHSGYKGNFNPNFGRKKKKKQVVI